LTTNRYIGRQWTPHGDWLYFVSPGQQGRQVLSRLNYRTQQIEEICPILRTFFKWEPGLSISPDGTRIAFSFLHHRLGDLMIVDGWR
jgi:Tol biopolymer transport system component